VRANCDAASCVVACGQDEILVTATCGARRAPAVYPTDHSASCHRHEPSSNPLIATCAKSDSVSALAAPAPSSVHAAAGEVPKLDVDATCRGASDRNKASLDSCMADEHRAQNRLATEWGQSAPAERTHCTQLSSMRGFQSYVELLTCLEMAKEAKNLPRDITQQ
jgi:hypothetical protein